ncbi:MAG: NADH-quinone oxidoreductase subunit [Solirubrobacteraceae bacterium]|nr:NADH-quinone oxidoreductase subunit [Solirubrobacteraceae bacterium]
MSPDTASRLATLVRRFEHGSRVPGWDRATDLDRDPAVVPDLATTPVTDELRTLVEDYMTRYPDRRSASIPSLRAAQRIHGWLSPTAIEQVAAVMRLTPGYLIAVATFYDMFEHAPVGEHAIYVCTNISCSLRGGDKIYEAMLDAAGDDIAFNVRSFECLGACDIAPMASVNTQYVGPLGISDCKTIVQQLRDGEDVLPAKQLARAPVAKTWWASGQHPVGEPAGGRGAEGETAASNAGEE